MHDGHACRAGVLAAVLVLLAAVAAVALLLHRRRRRWSREALALEASSTATKNILYGGSHSSRGDDDASGSGGGGKGPAMKSRAGLLDTATGSESAAEAPTPGALPRCAVYPGSVCLFCQGVGVCVSDLPRIHPGPRQLSIHRVCFLIKSQGVPGFGLGVAQTRRTALQRRRRA